MKTRTKTLLAALMLLAISCKKESNTLQSSAIADESSTQALSSEANEIARGRTVRIGTQVWMTKNLDVSHYRNGDRIPQVRNSVEWSQLTTGAWCWHNNDPANGAVYGKLYNWYAVNDPRGLAPAGWHIPSEEERIILSTFLGGDAVAGGKMKATGTIEAGTGLWYAPNTAATNISGFTGLPGSYRNQYGEFSTIGHYGYWWSSTEYLPLLAWYHYMNYYNGVINRNYFDKRTGFSVRCVKD